MVMVTVAGSGLGEGQGQAWHETGTGGTGGPDWRTGGRTGSDACLPPALFPFIPCLHSFHTFCCMPPACLPVACIIYCVLSLSHSYLQHVYCICMPLPCLARLHTFPLPAFALLIFTDDRADWARSTGIGFIEQSGVLPMLLACCLQHSRRGTAGRSFWVMIHGHVLRVSCQQRCSTIR